MALRKPPKKTLPSDEDLDNFLSGADDRQQNNESKETSKTGKSKTIRKKTAKKKAFKNISVAESDKEKENYKYTFIILPSYQEKIRKLKQAGINVQPQMRKLVYPLIDKLLKDNNLDDE